MKVRENQLTEMIDTRNHEIERLDLKIKSLEKKLRRADIAFKDNELQGNDLV